MLTNLLWQREWERSRSVFVAGHRAIIKDFVCLGHHQVRLLEEGEESSMALTCRFGSSDACLAAVSEEGGFINIFRTGEEHQRGLLSPVRRWHAHRDAVFDICWNCDDRRLMSGSGDYHICNWDTETMTLIATFRGHSGSVKALRFRNSDPHVFASAGRDGHILVWDIRVPDSRNVFGVNVKQPIAELLGAHNLQNPSGRKTPSSSGPLAADGGGGERGLRAAKSVTSVVFSCDDTMLLSGGSDGRLKYWDTRQMSPLVHMGRVENPRAVVSLNVQMPAHLSSKNGAGDVRFLLSSSSSSQALTQSPSSAAPISRPHGIACIALNPAGNRVAAASLDNHIYEYDFYDPTDEACRRVYSAPISSFYAKICYSPSGVHLAAGSSLPHVAIFDAEDSSVDRLNMPVRKLEGHLHAVPAVDWSPHDNLILSSSDDGTTRLWTVQRNRPQQRRKKPRLDDADDDVDDAVQEAPPAPPEQQEVPPPPPADPPVNDNNNARNGNNNNNNRGARRDPGQTSISRFFKPV